MTSRRRASGSVLELELHVERGAPRAATAWAPHTTLLHLRIDQGRRRMLRVPDGARCVALEAELADALEADFPRSNEVDRDLRDLDADARSRGRVAWVISLAGPPEFAHELPRWLRWLEAALFRQERRAVVRVTTPSVRVGRVVEKALRQYVSARAGVWRHGRGVFDALATPCREVLWCRQAGRLKVLHRCTHERFELTWPEGATAAHVTEAARAQIGLDHAPGAALVRARAHAALERARASVPAYRDVVDVDQLPLVDAAELSSRGDAGVAHGVSPRALASDPTVFMRTSSGTTAGVPRWHVIEREVRFERADAEAALWNRTGPSRSAVVNRPAVLFAVPHGADIYRARREAPMQLRVTPGENPTRIPADRWQALARAAAAFEPRSVVGDPQYLVGLARVLRGAPSARLREVVLTNHFAWTFQRRLLADAFRVPVRDLYHSGEASTMAVSCPLGHWHLLETYGHYELVRGGRAAREGAMGLLAVTAFDVAIRPIFRYVLGDLCRIVARRCACGRPARRVILEGRTAHCFQDGRGRWVTPRALDRLVGEATGITHLAVIRTPRDLVLRAVGDAGGLARVAARIERVLACPVRVETASSLPLASSNGKLQLFDVPNRAAELEAWFRTGGPNAPRFVSLSRALLSGGRVR